MNGDQGNNNVTQREIDDMGEIIKRQEERIHNLETKALQVINLYFVFQGVILSSTSSGSALKCRHWRIPFVLSLFATLLNGFAFFVTIFAILRARDELDVNEAKRVTMLHGLRVQQAAAKGQQGAPGAQGQAQTAAQGQQQAARARGQQRAGENNNMPEADAVAKGRRYAFAFMASGLFVGFSVVILYGCIEILCHSSR